MVTAHGYTLVREDCGRANGSTGPLTRVVRVRRDVDDAQAAKTLAHELAHVLLHCNPTDGATETGESAARWDYRSCRAVAEVEAESVAFIVAGAYGLDTSAYTTPYVAGWAAGEPDKIRAPPDSESSPPPGPSSNSSTPTTSTSRPTKSWCRGGVGIEPPRHEPPRP